VPGLAVGWILAWCKMQERLSRQPRTAWCFVEFFTATIRSSNTREVYARIIVRFLSWCAGFYPR
jgi:hypothetical protein